MLCWSISLHQMSCRFTGEKREEEKEEEEEKHHGGKSDLEHLLPLRILWAIIGGWAHTSRWQGSSKLKRNKKQKSIKSQRDLALSDTHIHTRMGLNAAVWGVWREFSTQRSKERERRREKGSATLIFPLWSASSSFCETLYRSLAFSLFVILGAQNRSQR